MDATLRLAIYGAILSTILAIWQIILAAREISKEKRRLLVTFFQPESPYHIGVQAVNIGSRPVVVTRAGFIWRDRRRRENGHYFEPDALVSKPPLPRKPQDGEMVQIDVDLAAEDLAYFRANPDDWQVTKLLVVDAEGSIYKGKLEDYGYMALNHSEWTPPS